MKNNTIKKPSLTTLASAISVGLLSMGYTAQADAFTTVPSSLLSHVTDSVTDNNDGSWSYDFTVHNDTFSGYGGYGGDSFEVTPINSTRVIVDWELPYFADMGITNIQSPNGWSHAIETIGVENPVTGWQGTADWQTNGDPWKTFFDGFYGSEVANPYNDHTQVLHWYIPDDGPCELNCNLEFGIFPQLSKSGFGFDAGYGEGQAPYQASWDNLLIQTGDPAFPDGAIIALPNSPSINPVPLPGAWIFMMSGLVGVAGMTRRIAQQ